jgi:hypothetical protein
MTAMIIDASGVRPAADALEVGKQIAAGRFFWLDISGGDPSSRQAFLIKAELNAADAAWALRFGQAGRMHIGVGRLRTATWIADRAGNIIELHLIGREKCIATLWGGDPATLDDVRRQFAERLGGIENNLYEAAGILLQLLLGTLGFAFEVIDMKLDDLRLALGRQNGAPDSAVLAQRLQALQSTAASFNRYLGSVRAATTGIETVRGAGVRGAVELNDYADQVEDLEQQLFERRQWMSNIIHDFSAEIARKQGEQINRPDARVFDLLARHGAHRLFWDELQLAHRVDRERRSLPHPRRAAASFLRRSHHRLALAPRHHPIPSVTARRLGAVTATLFITLRPWRSSEVPRADNGPAAAITR